MLPATTHDFPFVGSRRLQQVLLHSNFARAVERSGNLHSRSDMDTVLKAGTENEFQVTTKVQKIVDDRHPVPADVYIRT